MKYIPNLISQLSSDIHQTSGKLSLSGHFTTKLVKFGHSCNTYKNILYTSMNKR